MKVGTLSLNINTEDLNYGAMLHSWAFIQFLKKEEGVECAEIIDYTTPRLEKFDRTNPVISYAKMHRWKSTIKSLIAFSAYRKRLYKFDAFVTNYMIVSKEKYTKKKLYETELKYDCLICESDVIWSPYFFGGTLDETFFLTSEKMKDTKKIIYSASTGNGTFSEAEKRNFSELIRYPDYISCRESYGTKLIKECGREDTATVVDPVLLLEATDYNIITSPRLIDENYLLIYIPLGYDSRYVRTAQKYAKNHNLAIVEISYYVWNNIKHAVMADVGIEEFLSLIRNADVIFTNSFHAVCFSCLFHKQFYAFERKTGRKTEDLCKRLDLSDHYMNINEFHETPAIDFSKVEKLLDEERSKSIAWLEAALNS